MTTANDFLARTDITGRLTPEQAAEFMQLEQGDTGDFSPEQEAAPAVTASTDTPPDDEAAQKPSDDSKDPLAAADEPDPAQAVVLAKDGKHTIPYQKLLDARSGEQHWKAQAEAARQQLEALQSQAQQRADDGARPTTTDNMVKAAEAAIDAGVDASIFGDFSEAALSKGIQTLVDRRVTDSVNQALAPLREQQRTSAAESHYQAIFEAHPDATSIAQSVEMDSWIRAQPSYAQPAMRAVLETGMARDVIELFDDFKRATGASQPSAAPNARAAQAAMARAAPAVPASLSGIPGGRVAGTSAQEQMAEMAPAQLSEAMSAMSPDAIDAFLNRNL